MDEEFWASLTRLYDSTVQTATAVESLRKTAESLQHTAEALQHIAGTHENRLDKLEVVQEWLAQRERKREKNEQGG